MKQRVKISVFSAVNCVPMQDESRPVVPPAGEASLQPVPLSSSPVSLLPVFSSAPAAVPAVSPEADGKAADENGDVEMEPMRNGAGHISETESSDSGANPGDKDNSTGASQDMEGLTGALSLKNVFSIHGFICNLHFFPYFSNSAWWCRPGGV